MYFSKKENRKKSKKKDNPSYLKQVIPVKIVYEQIVRNHTEYEKKNPLKLLCPYKLTSVWQMFKATLIRRVLSISLNFN